MSESRPIELTRKEWRAIVQWFRSEEASLRYSYGEPGRKEQTFRTNYASADPTRSAIYEAAREVFGDQP